MSILVGEQSLTYLGKWEINNITCKYMRVSPICYLFVKHNKLYLNESTLTVHAFMQHAYTNLKKSILTS